MPQLLGIQKPPQESDGHWLPVVDLMAGLMMVFLFISIAFMLDQQQDNTKRINDLDLNIQTHIYNGLKAEFDQDLKKWDAHFEKDTLSIDFQSPELLFGHGSKDLSAHFKRILKDFFPRYVKVLKPYRDLIAEVRIEGHTSSDWRRNSTESDAYFNNLQLSQIRAREVFRYIYFLDPAETNWIKRNMMAMGFSSSKAVINDGVENAKKSRRISFRTIIKMDIAEENNEVDY